MEKNDKWQLSESGLEIHDANGLVAEFGFGVGGNNAKENAKEAVEAVNRYREWRGTDED